MEPPDEHIPNEDAQVNFMAAKHAKFKRKTAARRGAAPTLASSQLWETDDLSEKLIVLWAQLQPLLEEPPANPADDGLPGEVPNPQSKLLSARVERWNSLAAQNHAAQMRDGWIGSQPLASGPGGGPGRLGNSLQRYPVGTGVGDAYTRNTFKGAVDSYLWRHADARVSKVQHKKRDSTQQKKCVGKFADLRGSYEELHDDVVEAQHSVDPITTIRAATAALDGRATLHVAPDAKAIRLQRHEAGPKIDRVRLARTRSGAAADEAARHELLPGLPREALEPQGELSREPAKTRPLMWVRPGHSGGAAGVVPHSIDMSNHHKGTHAVRVKNITPAVVRLVVLPGKRQLVSQYSSHLSHVCVLTTKMDIASRTATANGTRSRVLLQKQRPEAIDPPTIVAPASPREGRGAWQCNRPCAHQCVGKSQSCMVGC